MPPPLRPASGPPRDTSGGRWLKWLIGAVAVAGVVVLLAVLAILRIGSAFDEQEAAGVFERDPDSSTPDLPPSERGLTSGTVPAAVPDANTDTEASRGRERFAELTCEFSGRSNLDPALVMNDLNAAAPHHMALEPGARFDCTDRSDRSAGTITLDADFDALSALAGVGAGSGRITWEQVAPAERAAAGSVTSSNTAVEVELDFPVIVVWTTILDGPYAGFRGKLVLREWERLTDGTGAIVGIEFARTSTRFTPL